MKIQIENLRAQMRGVQLNGYQRALALDEYYKLLDYVEELEKLTIPAVMANVGGMVNGGFKTTNLSKRTEVNE